MATINVAAPGAVTATPVCTTSGCPFEVTRIVPTTHCAVTHGGTGGSIPGHPATTHGTAIVAVAIPDTITRALGAVAIACPPCKHITTAPCPTKNPAIATDLSEVHKPDALSS